MMKTTKELLASKEIPYGFKEIGVKYANEFGVNPSFKTFRFNIYCGYEWGSGYIASGQKEFFEDVVCPAVMEEMGWSFQKGDSGSAPIGAKHDEGYVYMHPMEITGYIRPDLADKLIKSFEKFREGKVRVTSDITYFFDVFDMEDRDVAKYYYLHKDFFKNELKELINENDYLHQYISSVISVFYDKETKKYRGNKVYTSAGYNDDFLYRLFHIISKYEDECTTSSEAFDFFYDVMDVIINELFEEGFFKHVGKNSQPSYKPIKYFVA